MSSMGVGFLVYAKNQKTAKKKATKAMVRLLEMSNFEGFDDKHALILNVKTDDGMKKLDVFLRDQKNDLLRWLDKVRNGLKHWTNEDIWNGAERVFENREERDKTPVELHDIDMLLHYMHMAGQYWGDGVYLYSDESESIKNLRTLNNVMNKWARSYEDRGKENPYKDDEIFLVTMLASY